jgi:transcription antitermination protein NusB
MSSSVNSTSGQYGVRRRSREMAVQLLFQYQFHGQFRTQPQGQESDGKDLLKKFVTDFEIESEIADYGGTLFLGVLDQIEKIDEVIQAHSAHWKVSRMGLVDLSVMRVAVYEMKFVTPALQPNIVINEAVEIAKKFGSTESGSFVNGILDHIARNLK